MKINQFRVNFTDEQVDILYEKAKQSNAYFKSKKKINIAEYIRNRAVSDNVIVHIVDGLDRLSIAMEDMRKIGVNLNQLLHLVHERRYIEEFNNGTKTPILDGELKTVSQLLVEFFAMNEEIKGSFLDVLKSLHEVKNINAENI